jgi:hypothetical protein
MTPAELLTDAFERILQTASAAVDGLTEEQLATRAGPDANSIAWLVWHLARVQDDHVADVAGTEQVYTAEDFAPRFDLPFEPAVIGYGMSTEAVAPVRADPHQRIDGRRPRPGRRRALGPAGHARRTTGQCRE